MLCITKGGWLCWRPCKFSGEIPGLTGREKMQRNFIVSAELQAPRSESPSPAYELQTCFDLFGLI